MLWGLRWWREKVLPPRGMSPCRSSETTSLRAQPRHSGRGCRSAPVPPEVWSPGCPWHSAGSPGVVSWPCGPLPWRCNNRPPHPTMETQTRLNMSRNRLRQSLAPACCSPPPRVPPRMRTRGFVSNRPKPAHVFPLSPPGQSALRARAPLRETLLKIFKPQQTHHHEKKKKTTFSPKTAQPPAGLRYLSSTSISCTPRLLYWVIISISITSKIRRPPMVQIWEFFPGTQPAASPAHQAGTDLSKNSCSAPKWHWRRPQMPGEERSEADCLNPQPLAPVGLFSA